MNAEMQRQVELFRGAPEFRKRKALNALSALFSDKMPVKFLEIVQEVKDTETPMSPPVTRKENTDRILSVAKIEFNKMCPEWLDDIIESYGIMIDSLDHPDYEKKRAKGSFSAFINGIVSNFKINPKKRRKNG